MSTVLRSLASGGSQSTSKYEAYWLDGPFSSTSHHHRLPPTMAMWLGTMSRTWPSSFSPRAAHMRSWPASPPSSALTRLWSITS